MEILKIVIGKNGNVINAPKDFNIYLGSYGNVKIAVAVPIDLLGGFEVGENQSIQTVVKIGLKWTNAEGDMGQTQALNLALDPEQDYEDNGVQYRVFTADCPQVFTAQTGLQKLICNIVNSLLDGENAEIQSRTTTAEIPFRVFPSAVLEGQIIQEQEEINELEQVQGAVNSLISETDILKNTKLDKQSDIETVYTINADGEQTQVPYSQNPQEGAIVQRGANGAVKTGIPTEDEDATPKKYVDDYNAGQDEIIQDKADKTEAVLKYNIGEPLPDYVFYNKNGYKTPGVFFSGETFAIPFYTGQLPQNETGAVRVFNVRDFAQSETQKYQDEIFEFKGGNAMRTILIDFEDGGNPVVLEVGAWGNVCQELFDDIDNRINGLQTVDKGGALHYIVTDNSADLYFVDIDINDFNAHKTQFNLTEFACADIWGDGDFYYDELGTLIFDYENDTTTAIKNLYWKNISGAIYKVTNIFNGTWVINQTNGHQYRLDNNISLDTFWWGDKGIDLTQVATNNKHGVVKGAEDDGENDYKINVDASGEMGVNLSQAKRDAIESGASMQKFTDIDEDIADEKLARENADEELQSQIDKNTEARENLGLNGFVNYQQANFTFDNATRTLGITAVSIPYEFYVQSKKFNKAADSFVISNSEGLHHIYYGAGGVLSEMVGEYSIALILDYCFVATIYWDAENQKAIYVANEWRHGIKMSSATHLRLHAQDGFVVARGGELTDISIGGDGSLDTHCQVGTSTTTAYDEDALFQPQARSPLANLPLLWQVGNSWRSKENDPFPVIVGENGRAVYNGTISGVRGLIEAESGKFVTCHIAVTNDASRPYIGFMGQVQYNGVSEARGLIIDEIKSFYAQGLPMQELQFLGTLLIQTSDTFTNSVKSRTLSIDTGVYYVDLRQLVTPRGSITIGMGGGKSIIHNDTTGIQGGGEGEYYHLTQAEKNDIVTKSTAQEITGNKDFLGTVKTKDLYVDGDIIQQGEAYETHAEHLQINDQKITLRQGADTGLGVSEMAGLEIEHYDADGNTGNIKIDKDGVLRIGDTGNLQPVATRQESPTNGQFAKWNSTNARFETAEITKADVNLANVDNTTDINKPISTATQTALNTKDVQPYLVHATGAGNGWRLVAKFDYSAAPTTDSRKVFRFKVKQGHGNGVSYVFWGDYIVGLGTTNQVTCSGVLSKSDGTFGKCGYRVDAANHTIYFYIHTGQYSAYFTSDITSLTPGTIGTVTWYTEAGLTADTVIEGVSTFYPIASGMLALESNLNTKVTNTKAGIEAALLLLGTV